MEGITRENKKKGKSRYQTCYGASRRIKRVVEAQMAPIEPIPKRIPNRTSATVMFVLWVCILLFSVVIRKTSNSNFTFFR